MIEVGLLRERHASGAARLHLSFLRTKLQGRPGRELLELYYRNLASTDGACGYVAEDGDSMVGYVCGVWDPSAVRSSLLRSHWPRVLFWGGVLSVVKPSIIMSLVGRLMEPLSSSDKQKSGYELRPIVVSPSHRGAGTASQLVNRLLVDADKRGFSKVHLVTEVSNVAARRFYEKMGFLQGTAIDVQEARYVKYVCRLKHRSEFLTQGAQRRW